MELFFSDIRKETDKGRLLYHDTVFYKDKNYAYSQDFDYLVFDYGNCTRNDGIPNDFYSNDFRVVVCGGNAEEVAALTQLSRQLYSDEQIRYVFSFIDEQEQAEVLDLMVDRAEMVYFAPYVPDCFREYEQSILLCRRLLALQEEPPIGKSAASAESGGGRLWQNIRTRQASKLLRLRMLKKSANGCQGFLFF